MDSTCSTGNSEQRHALYRRVLEQLNRTRAPYLVGGAYAMEWMTGISRRTKDLDLFVRREDCQEVLELLTPLGCDTWIESPHWLAKAAWGADFIDIIFGTGNGQAIVDDLWFEHALTGELFGVPVSLVPAEEAIWTKAFIMERERFDGADVAHLLRATAAELDWSRLLWRFGRDWPVLLSHLVLFAYIYPGEAERIPHWVMQSLLRRQQSPGEAAALDGVCRGALLSRGQYLVDLDDWSYEDARVRPLGSLTREEARSWSAKAQDPPHSRR